MRVLGVDPGLTRCGVAVVEGGVGQKLSALHIGIIGSSPDTDLADRLVNLEIGLESLIETFAPDAIAIERVNFTGVAGAAIFQHLVELHQGIDAKA